jgi:hypothetical protein
VIACLDDVRALAINISPLPTNQFVGSVARIVDAYINGKMSMVYLEWIDIMQTGGPYPEIIKDCANLMTAGRIEMTQYAVNDAGRAQPNQYGVSIHADGKDMIDSIWNGDIPVIGLTRIDPIISAHPRRVFREVGGLRTQGVPGHGYYDGSTIPDQDFLGEDGDSYESYA